MHGGRLAVRIDSQEKIYADSKTVSVDICS